MSPDFTLAFPGLGEIVADDGSKWTLAGDGTVCKNGTGVFTSVWKGKTLQWEAPGLYLISPTGKCYALNRSTGSSAPSKWPEKDPPVLINMPESPPVTVIKNMPATPDEWKMSVAYDFFTKAMAKRINDGTATTEQDVIAIAQLSSVCAAKFVEKMIPPLIADPIP